MPKGFLSFDGKMTYSGSGAPAADFAQESIHEQASSSRSQRASRTKKKVALGSMVSPSLLGSFINANNSEYSRRSVWFLRLAKLRLLMLTRQMGTLALELLKDCEENKTILSDENETLR